ncbi:MAG: L,D-transpeptidase family protein, partial [Sphingomicrobium sp.]
VAPGTKGSPIDGTLFHAQILMSAHGFSPGVIDGKKGESFRLALRSFQESRDLDISGELDQATRRALLEANRPSTIMVELGPDDVRGQYVMPFPGNPEAQAELKFLGYRNMLERLAERYHTTPATIVALNGPDKMIGLGETLRLPNVVPASRDYAGAQGQGAMLMNLLNVDANQPQGNYVVVDKSEGVLKVYAGEPPAGPYSTNAGSKDAKTGKTEPAKPAGGDTSAVTTAGKLVAQFPVTMGSTNDPLPLGKWKTPTYAYLPPFHYQPNLFWDAKDSAKEHMLPPGPNGPVGVAWLDLTKEHYGIHGTPEPATIGKGESHGCIRMTNWDVIRLSRMLKPGFTAIFQA